MQRLMLCKKKLKEAHERGDWNAINEIFQNQPKLLALRQQLCRALGNRVVVR